ncbi:hypothetical protein [Streptomyces sp. DH12]|uniref:hypothetical protein n=1 Tax=Streptomyces sp. DH12 TaxID=2857010 RepID=UPI001E5E3492|nr:hypothetical protein [Streptomyces sp. DH12]
MRPRHTAAALALLAAAAFPAAATFAAGPTDDSIWGSDVTQNEPATTPAPAEDDEPGASIQGDSIWG